MQSRVILDVGGRRFKVSRLTFFKKLPVCWPILIKSNIIGFCFGPHLLYWLNSKVLPNYFKLHQEWGDQRRLAPGVTVMFKSLDYGWDFKVEDIRKSFSYKLARLCNLCRRGNKNLWLLWMWNLFSVIYNSFRLKNKLLFSFKKWVGD